MNDMDGTLTLTKEQWIEKAEESEERAVRAEAERDQLRYELSQIVNEDLCKAHIMIQALETERDKWKAAIFELKETYHEEREAYQKDLEALQDRYDELQAERDELADQIGDIRKWCRAYPVTVFPEMTSEDWAFVSDILKPQGYTTDRLGADVSRHVLNGIKKIVDDGEQDE